MLSSAEDTVNAPLEIETDRLILTVPTAADADAIFARYAGDPDVTRYMAWARHRSIDDTREFLAFSAAEWERWPAGPYLIRERTNGRLLGSTGPAFERPDTASTGYVLAKDAWGLGYATEALQAMVDLARRLDVARLYAICHHDHRASAHVLEKCGFTQDPSWSGLVRFPNLAPEAPQHVLCYERIFAATPRR